MLRYKTYALVLALGAALTATAVSARPAAVSSSVPVPDALAPWIDWVLFDHPDRDCPVVNGAAVCLWPGALTLDLTEGGGRFSFQLFADREMIVPLPGEDGRWPEAVTLDGAAVPVFSQNGVPSVTVPAGDHGLRGDFVWKSLPEGIAIPSSVGSVILTVDQSPIVAPKRDESGRLWLSGMTEDDDTESLDLSVMRRIEDGVPLMIDTRIVVRASGKAREIRLENVLLENTVPVSVTAPIPARLDQDGTLRVQVRPGTHDIMVRARTNGAPEKLAPPKNPPPWPEQEIWVWQADETLRQVKLSGAPGIDPSRTDLADEWRALPAYLLAPGAALVFHTTRRGEPSPPPDQLALHREMWLDLDGRGFTVRDHLSGTLNESSRLDLTLPGVLARATVDGADELITKGENGESGVELRRRTLDLWTEWRLASVKGSLPAVSWRQDVQSLSTSLYLPPGWQLLFAEGVDTVTETWWSKWDLFGFFFVLIVSIAIAKLTRWYVGIIALIALTLAHHETDAPFAVWIAILITLALLKVVPKGKMRLVVRIAWLGSVVWLTAVLIPFSVTQMRQGLFPQVAESEDYFVKVMSAPDAPRAAQPAPPPMPKAKPKGGRREGKADKEALMQSLEEISASELGGMKDEGIAQVQSSLWGGRQDVQLTQDPKAVVQTGLGVPAWTWHRWTLDWTGPVSQGHTLTLYMLSPVENLVIAVLRVLLLIFIAVWLVKEGARRAPPKVQGASNKSTSEAAAAATTAVLAFAILLVPGRSRGDDHIPDENLLNLLEQRLLRTPECRPDCLDIPHVDFNVWGNTLRMTVTADAAEKSALPLPGPIHNWVPKTVTVDGRKSDALAALEDGYLFVRLEKGVHRIVAEGPLPKSGALSLVFAKVPKRVSAIADTWVFDGIRADGRVEGAVQLTRKAVERGDGKAQAVFEEGVYPPWLEITRELSLGIPWRVTTTVRRLSPLGTPILVAVPLLSGESVTVSELEVADDKVNVSLDRDQEVVSWTATLKEQKTLTLNAPSGKPWTETWRVQCSPVWQCGFDDLVPISRNNDDRLEPMFKPWPGEKLIIRTHKPEGVKGVSVTIDSASLALWPGKRLVKSALTLSVRTSRGGEQALTLPKGSVVQKVEMDGSAHPYRQADNQLLLSLKTGAQQISVEWQEPGGLRSRYAPRPVSLNRQAANATVTVHLPNARWLIYVGGPRWGPAVLFWGFLLSILLGGLILGRIKLSPLRSWQWMLLSLGLTQLPVPAILIIVSWFLLLAWRAQDPLSHRVWHNLLQLFIPVWTAVAVGCLVVAVYQGLAVNPDMQVAGQGSTQTELNWYVDRIEGQLPTPWVLSVPLLVWQIIMLAWALWLAASIVRWAPWSFHAFTAGDIWKRKPEGVKDAEPTRPVVKQETDPAKPDDAPSGT